MKTTKFFGLALLASALAGCALNATDSRTDESVATTRAAETAPYLQTFDADFQSVIFQPSVAIDWVILHAAINGERATNVPMPGTGTSAAAGPSYEIGALPVLAGDAITYSFTYAVDGVAHDTPQFTYALARTWTPTTFATSVTDGAIEVTSTAPLAWADVHYAVNGGPQQNVRLTAQGSRWAHPVTLAPGDVLDYSVTYSTGVAVFDTAVARYTGSTRSTPPTNLLAGPWRFVGSDLSPSTAYAIHGDAIDLDFQGYFSWNGTWASGYQGYAFEQAAPVAQGATYVLTVVASNSNVGLPVVVKASLSGAGAAQQQMSMGNGVLTFTFDVASDPGSAPVIDLVAHPVLGHLGPVEGTGIGVESYTLTASLTKR
jgi:hypothetical protein